MKKIILAIIIISSVAFGQSSSQQLLLLFGNDTTGTSYDGEAKTNLYAVDLDGSTEYLSKTSPTSLDLNGSELISNQIDGDMEVGSDLIVNGGFSSDTWWSKGTNVTIADGVCHYTNVPKYYGVVRIGLLTAGNYYKVTFTIKNYSSGGVNILLNGYTYGISTLFSGNGTYTYTGRADGSTLSFDNESAGTNTFDLDDISVVRVPSYTATGNHSIDTSSAFKHAGTYSMRMIATGAGNSTTNYISLAADKITPLVDGEKYTLEMYAKVPYNLLDTLRVNIGGQTKKFAFASTDFEKKVWNFQATASEVNQPIKLYLNQADTCYIDVVSLTQAYDAMVSIWAKTSDATNILELIDGGTRNSNKMGFALYYRTAPIYNGVTARINNLDIYGTTDISTTLRNGNWHFINLLINRTGTSYLYSDGTSVGSGSLITAGKIIPYYAFAIGAISTGAVPFNGQIGEVQITRFTSLPATIATDITTNYNRGLNKVHMKSSYTNGDIVFWAKWLPGSTAIMLNDESASGNDLDGTNVVYPDDSVILEDGYVTP